MTDRRHILFAAHPTVGHTSALRAIGAELRARGHATSFAIVHARVPFASLWPEPVRAASGLPGAIAAEAAEVLELAASPASLWHAARLPRATGQAELEIALALFTSGLEAQARQMAAHIRRTGAGLVVGDYLMPAALLGARRNAEAVRRGRAARPAGGHPREQRGLGLPRPVREPGTSTPLRDAADERRRADETHAPLRTVAARASRRGPPMWPRRWRFGRLRTCRSTARRRPFVLSFTTRNSRPK